MSPARKPSRRGTSTSSFGVSRRENHDASNFYARFTPPEISADEEVAPVAARAVDDIFCRDAKGMTKKQVADASVALVVTSPPYFAGKDYETALGEGHVPASYLEYLTMLREVFAKCVTKLEPGGRIAVNVANLGRKPYRSLASDIVAILQDDLGLLLRGEIIWVKARGATGSCAWGSYQSSANPTLRDLTERIVVASRGRMDRAISRPVREELGLPWENSIVADEFMEATTDVWEIAPERATRVGHPAPFPVELPERLIHLFTYRNDLVLDPFMGSGSTAIAALRTGRHFAGFDTDPAYVDAAKLRVKSESERMALSAVKSATKESRGAKVAPMRTQTTAKKLARTLIEDCDLLEISEKVMVAGGVRVDFSGVDSEGKRWLFDVAGTFTTAGVNAAGLKRPEALWKALGRASVLRCAGVADALVILTTGLPTDGVGKATLTRALSDGLLSDVVELASTKDCARLVERMHAIGTPSGGRPASKSPRARKPSAKDR